MTTTTTNDRGSKCGFYGTILSSDRWTQIESTSARGAQTMVLLYREVEEAEGLALYSALCGLRDVAPAGFALNLTAVRDDLWLIDVHNRQARKGMGSELLSYADALAWIKGMTFAYDAMG